MRLVLRKRMRALLEGCLAASVAMAALAACDSTATLYISEVKFDSVFVVSAYPSKKATAADGSVTYEPVCHFTDAASGPSGLTLSVLLRGTQKKEESTNNDLSIRPGDRIALKEVTESNVTPALFKLSFDCVEPYPDADLQSCPAGSLKAPDLGLDRVDFYRYNTDAEDSDESVAVAVMLDMSGSMVGFVHAAPPYYEDLFDNVVQAGAESGEGYGKLGTYPTGEIGRAHV